MKTCSIFFFLGLGLLTSAGAQTTTTKKPAVMPHPKTVTAAKKPITAAHKPEQTVPVTTLKDTKEKFSYALGLSLGTNLRRQEVEIDPEIVARGLKDALTGSQHLLTDEEAEQVLSQMQTEVREKLMAKLKAEDAKNKADGGAFLAANKTKPGVVTLPSGLQYKIITEGTGPKPTASDTVVCNYRGTLLNGKEFDSSYKRNEPVTLPVTGVIKGWTEALQRMPVGSKWQLFVPADLAYGDRGAGPDIGPGSTLIFEVELLSIKSKSEPDKAEPKK